MRSLSLTALLAVAALSSASVVQSPVKDDTFELLILHNNDMHARFEQTSQFSGACTTTDREAGKCYGGFPRVAHVVKEARRAAASGKGPPVLYLNAGDTYTGTAWFTIYKWQIAAEFINALQPDAVSLGNHEFDNGVSGLTPFIENVTCPVLCTNLVLNKVPELAKEENLKNSIVLNVTGVKVGIIGYLTPETKELAVANDVEYIDEIIALRKEVKKLQNEGINIIIALGHSGYSKDLEIAKEVEGVDLVIGGHTNTFLWNGTTPDSEEPQGPYPTYVIQSSGKSVPVVQAYAYTKYLGSLNVIFNSQGEITKAYGMPILLDKNIPQDPEVLDIIEKYRSKMNDLTNEIVGETSVILDGPSCTRKECNLGNLITDSMVYKYIVSYYRGEHWTDAPIAIMQGGGIRNSIVHAEMPTNITSGDLLSVMPFDGKIVLVQVNGTVLLQMLEHAVARYDVVDVAGEFLQFSGIKVVYDLNKPSGSRVVKAEARCWTCKIPEYVEIKTKEFYNVLMPGFVSTGGDGYWMFKDLPTKFLNDSELSCTKFFVSHQSPIYHGVEGRITFLNEIHKSSSSIPSLSMAAPFICLVALVLLRTEKYL